MIIPKLLYSILNSIALVNILILCSFLIVRKNNVLTNYLLAAILAIPGLYIADNILITTGLIQQVPYAFFVVQIVANLFPVLVYWYIHLLLVDHKKLHPILLAGSIILAALSVGFTCYFSQLSNQDQSDYLAQLFSDNYPWSMDLYNVIFYVWQMVYLVVLYKELKRYQIKVKENLATTDGVKVYFAKRFVRLLAYLNFVLLGLYLIFPAPMVDYGALPVIVTIIYGFIMYDSWTNNAIFDRKSYEDLVEETKGILSLESQKEVTNNDSVSELGEKIQMELHEHRIFLNPKLKLSDLAEQIDAPAYLTSQAINSNFNKSFYDFINEYRVREAEVLLRTFDSKRDKIENIAYAAGFNSRASFYRSFKKVMGKNPSDFVS